MFVLPTIYWDKLKEYVSVLKIFELVGFGIDNCFLGANDDESKRIKKELLPPVPINLLLMFIRFERSLVFLFYGEYALFLGGYIIFFFLISFNIKNYLFFFLIALSFYTSKEKLSYHHLFVNEKIK